MIKKVLLTLFIVVVLVYASFKFTPYPSVWLIRYSFNKEAKKANDELSKFVSDRIESKLDVNYNPDDSDAYLDIYYPRDSTTSKLPLIIWTHGGGLISGNKEQLGNYCKMLAAQGYIVASIDYTVAPGGKYPKPLSQLIKATEFLSGSSDLPIKNSKIILAGDSGGSMIAAQVANIITSKEYSALVNLKAEIKPEQLVGTILYCGIYDASRLNTTGPFGSFLKTVVWSYFGKKDITNDQYAKSASVTDHLTKDFPPSFISAGDADPLLGQSRLIADRLSKLSVPVDTLFYTKDHNPPLAHEYQFTYNEAGRIAFDRSVKFLKSVTN